VLAARELLMVVLTRIALKRGIELQVKMLGRWAVWPTMAALALAMITDTWLSEVLLYVGIALTLGATAEYLADGWRHLRPSSSG
jgi:phosphatidylglycerophosphate synthase